MLGYRGSTGFSIPRHIPPKYLVLVSIFIICFYFLWMATGLLEGKDHGRETSSVVLNINILNAKRKAPFLKCYIFLDSGGILQSIVFDSFQLCARQNET